MTIIEIANEIKRNKSALIFCHARPDGDTLSSAFALKYALEKLKITADVCCADKIPEKYLSLGFFGDILNQTTKKYDLHIAVDCAQEGMMGSCYALFASSKNTISIDHHISNTRYAKINYVKDNSANAINVYDLIRAMDIEIDHLLASILYLGIMTDTGNFSQSNTDFRTLEVACELCKKGASPNKIYNAMFRNQSSQRAKLYALVMSKMKYYHNEKLAIITITKSDLDSFGLDSSVTEGFIDFPLSVGSCEVAVAVLEKSKECYKISFRSKNYVNVNELAQTFGGGGHVRASGAVLNGIYEDVIDKIVFNVGNYL